MALLGRSELEVAHDTTSLSPGRIRKSRWLWTALITVSLGAVGSGFWELFIKPILPKIAEVFLYIATLGLDFLRDAMYLDVAKGAYERASLSVLGAVTGIFIGMILTTSFFVLFSRKMGSVKPQTYRMIIDNNKIRVLYVCAGWILIGFFQINHARLTYIIQAVSHIEQMQAIVLPYISNEQRILIKSKIASIHSRSDYKHVDDTIRHTLKENNVEAPDFDIF